jgi:hypothetical protein
MLVDDNAHDPAGQCAAAGRAKREMGKLAQDIFQFCRPRQQLVYIGVITHKKEEMVAHTIAESQAR